MLLGGHASSFSLSVALAVASCAAPQQQPAGDAWQRHEPSSKNTVRIAELSLATGLSASAFGGGTMAVGKAVANEQGDVAFWIGVGTLGMGIVATTVSIVFFTLAGVQYAAGD